MKHTVAGQSNRPHRTPAAARVPSRSSIPASVSFNDNRPEAIVQRRLTDAIHHSPYMVAQRHQLRGLFGEAAQLKGGPEEEELLQGKFAPGSSMQMKDAIDRPNASTQLSTGNTGLPDNLKSGIESLSGMSMDAVKVHYNSSQPAQLNALAYAQGTDIHVAPGQEQHLPHEAWHVVQQAQGRVKPTMQMKDGVPVNDDKGLEHEADVMGAKAAQGSGVITHSSPPQDRVEREESCSQLERIGGPRGKRPLRVQEGAYVPRSPLKQMSVQRHSLEEAAEEEEVIQARRTVSSTAIQRKNDEEIKSDFDADYEAGKKTEAVNVLKNEYQLNAKDYTLSAEQLPKSSTHASTGGGWNSTDTKFTPIRVRVNEPYLDKQAQSDAGYKKLLHTLGHEYQHVEQRSQKGWRTTGGDSAKGEREFKAYSWEVLDAKEKNKIPDLDKKELLSTIAKAMKYYATMDSSLKTAHQERYDKLLALKQNL